MKINERGYWENDTQEGHGWDVGLAKGLVEFFINEGDLEDLDVVDIGCGTGYYTKYLRDRGISCFGFDGNPHTPELSGGLCKVADFSIPQQVGYFDWAFSLEVAEHIPAEYEEVFLDNIDRHNMFGVILSWSIPTHGGDGHVNPKENQYVTNKMWDRGYYLDPLWTAFLRNSCSKYPNACWWFSKTIFVFRRKNDHSNSDRA